MIPGSSRSEFAARFSGGHQGDPDGLVERYTHATSSLLCAAHQKLIVFGLALQWALACLAQSNTAPVSGSSPLTGSQVGTMIYSPILEVGSGSFSVRVLRVDYWTDAAGRPIQWAARQPRQPGDKSHTLTRVILGRLSLSLPMPPAVVAVLGVAVVLLIPFAAWAFKRWREDDSRPADRPTGSSS